MEPSDNKVPKHVGIILDGNRRFSKKLMLKPWQGHEWGAKKIEKLFDWCKEFEEITKDYNNYIVNFAMAYGGRAEIIDAVKKLGQDVKDGKLKVEDINENSLSSGLYLNSEPDLIIRTGGEKRLSSFLLWQGHYAELVFLDKFWPEFEKEDFVGCLEEYSNRQRRFGK